MQQEREQHAAHAAQARQADSALRAALSAANSEAQQLREDCGLKEGALLDEVTRLRQEVRDVRRTGKTSEALAEEVRALEADLQRARSELASAEQGRQAARCEVGELEEALAGARRKAAVCPLSEPVKPGPECRRPILARQPVVAASQSKYNSLR